MISWNRINAKIKTTGVYNVDTTADKLDPILFNESKNNTSAIVIPKIPLINKIYISWKVNFGIGIENKIIVKINPKTPTRFFTAFRWSGSNLFDAISKQITAEDQQIAVIIAYKSPILC